MNIEGKWLGEKEEKEEGRRVGLMILSEGGEGDSVGEGV
jgi:hypothetical protein